MQGVVRFGKNEKLSPHCVGPYEILQRVDKVSYELKLPSELASVHPIFHVSMLKKCIGLGSTVARPKLKGINGGLHKRWSM